MNPVFLDTETAGLDPVRHDIYEVAAIVDDVEYHWWLRLERPENADPIGLSIGRYHERHPDGNGLDLTTAALGEITRPADFAAEFVMLTHRRHLAGAVVSFDEERLRRLILLEGQIPSWHYHLIDVEALAVGYLFGDEARARDEGLREIPGAIPITTVLRELPWDSKALSRAVGVDPEKFEQHTALGDARWAKAIYQAVLG